MNDPRKRDALLGVQPDLLGETWARGWFQSLLDEGRQVSGGWPGTIQEARGRARAHCDRELRLRGMPPLTHDELEQVASAIYERAKRDWLRVVRERKVPSTRF